MALLWTLSICSALCLCLAGAEFTCPTLFNFYPHKYDCTKFYRCNWGKAKEFSCGAGTRWSQSILTCDRAENVPCTKTPPVSTYVDRRTGQIYQKYHPELEAPDFFVDYDTHATQDVHYPDHHLSKDQYPDYSNVIYNRYPRGQYPEPYYTTTYPTHTVTRVTDYTRYRPHLQYHKDNYNVKYHPVATTPDYVYTTYPTRPTLPYYDYYTTAGYVDPTYNPKVKVRRDDLQPGFVRNSNVSPDYSDKTAYGKQYDSLPAWFPIYYAYQQSQNAKQSDNFATEKHDDKTEKPAPWLSSDLFRAGYGYKRIYVKK